MSYHGQTPPDYDKVGIAVVNPLHEIQRKLNKIAQIINDLHTAENEDAGVVAFEHIHMIADIIDGLDSD
jgi:hypothetical protein|tara:strand:+ start:284 stop:490 length:207 start_codon:yes stop_codon:yes gene_type:complete